MAKVVLAGIIIAAAVLAFGGTPRSPVVDDTPREPALRPGESVRWLKWPVQRERHGKTPFHADILSHLPGKYGNQYDFPDALTSGHGFNGSAVG